MLKFTVAAITAIALFSTSAEAARLRFGSSKRVSAPTAEKAPPRVGFGVGAGVIVTPRSGNAQAPQASVEDSAPRNRVPFPPSSPPAPRLQQANAPQPGADGCGGKPVGGFCILN